MADAVEGRDGEVERADLFPDRAVIVLEFGQCPVVGLVLFPLFFRIDPLFLQCGDLGGKRFHVGAALFFIRDPVVDFSAVIEVILIGPLRRRHVFVEFLLF